jgi:hypothetical protein
MAKRIMAVMIALTMCAGIAGCGKNGKDSSKSTKETSSAAGDTDSAGAESEIKALTDLRSENIMYKDITGNNDKPTVEEALMFSQLAVEQYTAAQTGDAEKFKQTINFESLLDTMPEILTKYFKNNDTDGIMDEVNLLWGIMLLSSADEDEVEKAADDPSVEKIDKLLKQAYENFDPDDLDNTIWAERDTLEPLGDIDENTVLEFVVNDFTRDGDDMTIGFKIVIFNGEYRTSLNNIVAWKINGETGIMFAEAVRRTNEYQGMTGEEIDQQLINMDKSSTGQSTARWVYNIVSDYCEEKARSGEDIKTVLETDFPQCSSSAGLDLAGDEPEAEGDRFIWSMTKASEPYDGIITFGAYDEEMEMPEDVIYTSVDGEEYKYHADSKKEDVASDPDNANSIASRKAAEELNVPSVVNAADIEVYDNTYDENGKPTNEELAVFADMALEAYRAAQKNDRARFTEISAFDRIADPLSKIQQTDNDLDNVTIKWDITLFDGAADEKFNGAVNNRKKVSAEEYRKQLEQALEEFNFDNTNYNIWQSRDELDPMGELESDPRTEIALYNSYRSGEDIAVSFHMDVYSGDDDFHFINVYGFRIDGVTGVLIETAYRLDSEDE